MIGRTAPTTARGMQALVALAVVAALLMGAWWQHRTMLCGDALQRRRSAVERYRDDLERLADQDVHRYCLMAGP
jgi:hypothetical protein